MRLTRRNSIDNLPGLVFLAVDNFPAMDVEEKSRAGAAPL
jgi:hypothetical protein